MANLQKKSLDELLRLDAGLTDLFSSGISSDTFSTEKENGINLFLVLRFQQDIQTEIRKRILEVIPQCELETAPQIDNSNNQ